MDLRARNPLTIFILAASLAPLGCSQLPHSASRKTGEEAHVLAPGGQAEIQTALGRSFESQGEFSKAEAVYQEAIKRDPKHADASIRLAILLDRMGRFAEATPHYEAAIKAEPGNADVYCDRGYSLCLQGRDAEAEIALRQAIVKSPTLARAHNNLGLLLGRKARTDEALAEFRKAGCPEVDAHLNLAFALSESKRWAEAKIQLQLVKTLGKGTPEILEGTTEIETMIARAEAPLATSRDPNVLQAGDVKK